MIQLSIAALFDIKNSPTHLDFRYSSLSDSDISSIATVPIFLHLISLRL